MNQSQSTKHTIEFENSFLQYITFGEGDEPIIAFHGFGGSAFDFHVFNEVMQKQFKVYSIFHFHHGESNYTGKHFSKEDLKLLFEQFFEKHNIKRFSLMGFSFGGIIAFTLLELFPERINKVYLFAPDGLKVNYFYRLVTDTWLGGKFFRYSITNPKPLFFMMQFFKKIKLLNNRVASFLFSLINTEQKRKLVLEVWKTYRHINPDICKIKKEVIKSNIPVLIVLGRHDHLIDRKVVEKFMQGLDKNCELRILKSGHNLITENTGKIIFSQD